MIELIFAWKRVQERHRSAPLLKERERYLVHLREQGLRGSGCRRRRTCCFR